MFNCCQRCVRVTWNVELLSAMCVRVTWNVELLSAMCVRVTWNVELLSAMCGRVTYVECRTAVSDVCTGDVEC